MSRPTADNNRDSALCGTHACFTHHLTESSEVPRWGLKVRKGHKEAANLTKVV